ncbi:MAG: cyclodeaminase/cyclohydrolase family protein, partial [Methylohalobius sp.]
ATEVPLACARLCAEVIELCWIAADQGNQNAITDAGVGALAAQAALQSCALNVTANLDAIQDQEFARACRAELDRLLAAQHHKVEAILQAITTRLAR